jgi:hypothetical protein
MVAAVLHWWNPLFWVARRKLRADAELACDAWAAGQADRRAYAEALLEVCSFNPRRRPAPAVGVFGEGRRAMQERLTMIMRDRVPCRLAFGAKLVVALMAIAAVPAWTLGQGKPVVVAADEIVLKVGDATVEDGDDETAKAIQAQIQALSQKLEALKAARAAGAEKKAAEKLKAAHEKLGEKMKELRVEVDARGGQGSKAVIAGPVKVLTAGHDGVKVIGPDGKEIQGARVIIGGAGGQGGAYTVKPLTVQGVAPEARRVELKVVGPDGKPGAAPHASTGTWAAGDAAKIYLAGAAGGGNAITLSRATYKLNKDQATALATLLGSIKATVMETKADGDSLTVTTTPEAQATIGQIVRLIQGQTGAARFEWKLAPGGQNLFVPAAPGAPAKPVAPPKPAAPVKPGATSAGPEKVDVKVIVDQLRGQLKPAAEVQVSPDVDAAKLQELLKTLKPLEFKLKAEKATKEAWEAAQPNKAKFDPPKSIRGPLSTAGRSTSARSN